MISNQIIRLIYRIGSCFKSVVSAMSPDKAEPDKPQDYNRIRYSFILSTLGKRPAIYDCLSNFNSFIQNRHDTELVIATTNPKFSSHVGKVYYFTKPENVDKYFLWRQASDLATGEIAVKVDDDVKLSRNFLDRCDDFFARQETVMVQPALVDADGYLILSKYVRSYAIFAVRRSLVQEFNLGTHLWCDTEFVEAIRRRYRFSRRRIIFDNESYALHYGYPGKSRIDTTADNRKRESSLKWGGRFDEWISKQKSINNYRTINLKEIFS